MNKFLYRCAAIIGPVGLIGAANMRLEGFFLVAVAALMLALTTD